jgi:S1-C subfamily serine protease
VILAVRAAGGPGQTIDLSRPVVVGRDEGCDLVLTDEKASRRHASLSPARDGTVTLEDLGSTNGTFRDGRRLSGPATLRVGDAFTIGDTVLELTSGAEAPAVPAGRPSVIERIALRRSAGRARVLAIAAAVGLVAAVVLVVLFATGVFGGSDEPSISGIVEEAQPRTAQIRRFLATDPAGTADDVSDGAGSGWVWDAEQGLVVTNAHVIIAAPKFSVRLATEQSERPAEIVAVSPCDDLAVLRVTNVDGMETMPLGSQADLRQGDTVVSLGFPASLAAGDNPTLNRGVVSVVETQSVDLGYTGALPNVIQSDNSHNPGNSGGPLLDLNGELVGVTTFSDNNIEGGRYSIGVDRVKEVVPDLVAGHSAGWTGIGWDTLATGDVLTSMGLPDTQGLLVRFVTPGSPAAQAGFPAPSLIVAIDGQPITSDVGAYCGAVGKKAKDETATFTVIPAGSDQPIDVVVPFA